MVRSLPCPSSCRKMSLRYPSGGSYSDNPAASVANLLSIHCEHTPQWACIRVRYRLCEQELVSSRRRFEPVSIITFKVSLRVRSQSGFLTVGPPGKTFATSWLNNFKNFGWVERLAFAPTSCPLTGRFRLTTPLSAKKTSASPTRFATAELKLANRKLLVLWL